MLTQTEYHEKLISCRQDNENFIDMNRSLSSRKIMDKLVDEFEMTFFFKETCAQLQGFSYINHIDLCVLEKEMCTLDLPSPDQWKIVEKFGRTKYTLDS